MSLAWRRAVRLPHPESGNDWRAVYEEGRHLLWIIGRVAGEPDREPGSVADSRVRAAVIRGSIDQASSGCRRASLFPRALTPGGFSIEMSRSWAAIRAAYGIPNYRISGGPDGIESDRYHITTRAAAARRAQPMRMSKRKDRFKLKVHRATKGLPVYALVVGKNGPKMKPGKDDGETEIGGSGHLINSRGMTMKGVAEF